MTLYLVNLERITEGSLQPSLIVFKSIYSINVFKLIIRLL